MKTICLLSPKGGSGKSTLSLHLAASAQAEGHAAAILDTDPQGTCWAWGRRRGEDSPVIVKDTNKANFKKRLKEFEASGIKIAVIDTPGMSAEEPMAAAALSDLILIPSRPGQADLEVIPTAMRSLALIDRVIPYYVILSISRASRGTLERDNFAIESLEQMGYPPGASYGAPTIHDRAAFDLAMRLGRSVGEVEPQGKAALETLLLWRWVAVQLKVK